jgi:hypothetical protein
VTWVKRKKSLKRENLEENETEKKRKVRQT